MLLHQKLANFNAYFTYKRQKLAQKAKGERQKVLARSASLCAFSGPAGASGMREANSSQPHGSARDGRSQFLSYHSCQIILSANCRK